MTAYRQDITRLRADTDKSAEHAALETLRHSQNPHITALKAIASATDDLPEIDRLAARIRDGFTTLVIMGMGGSCLGGRVLCDLPDGKPLAIHFVENIDPHSIAQLLAHLDMPRAFFLAISKSGGTLETLTQTFVCLEALAAQRGVKALADQCAVVTQPGPSAMRTLAESHRIPIIPHPADIGGRFSVLTAVGLIPAAVAGVNIRNLRAGAASVVAALDRDDAPPVAAAARMHALMNQGFSQSVMMPYCDRLAKLSSWYCQLWAESLGKDGKGQTPIRSIGAVDQHSQLQLFLDGPKDKVFTIITVNHAGKGPVIRTAMAQDATLAYLEGRHVGDVMAAEQQATAETLAARGCPVRLLHLDEISDRSIGALLMHLMLETVAMAQFMGINAFDQPAVEEGKIRTRAIMLSQEAAA